MTAIVPQVVEFYLSRGPRTDLRVKSLSSNGVFSSTTEQWVIVQESHAYFETEELITLLRLRHRPVAEFRMDDVTVLQLFQSAPERL